MAVAGVEDRDFLEEAPVSPALGQDELVFDESFMPPDDTDILHLDANAEQDFIMDGDLSDNEEGSLDDFDDDQHDQVKLEPPEDGVLDEDITGEGLSNLGRSADGTQQAFLHLTVPGYNLKDISVLVDYVHLQRVELPYNEITDLTPLSHMPYLIELDVSHNQLTTLLDFTPPKNLKSADLSFNNIGEMCDLSAHHYLSKLILDNNQISEIKGLEKCSRLQHLSLAHNAIDKIQGLDNLPITFINLSGNQLTKIENIDTLTRLQYINLSGNKIRSMNGLEGHSYLSSIDLEDNEVIDLAEVQYIRTLALLRDLNLQRNPIRELPDYRLSILFYVQQLTELDKRRADVEEKVAAANMFNPPMEIMAARDHIMHVVYSFLQPSRVLDSTLPSIETPYPTLVLVGPHGSGKTDLALKLVEEFSDYFGYGVTHTTRKPLPNEKLMQDAKIHHFVTLEEFEESIKLGRFLYSYSYHGDLYGLTLDAIEAVAKEGLACVVPMELEGVLTLKNTYFEPRYVLIQPVSSDIHERRLREKNIYTEPQIQWMLERKNLYSEHNKEHPGFFDMMITSDDIVDAYKQLRHLVMDYLGIRAPSPSLSDVDPSHPGSTYEKEGTMDTITGHSTLGRQWSRHSIPDSLSQALTNLKVKSAPSPMPTTGRGIVEEQSLQRRQSAAKQTVSGHVPSIYEQLLQQAPHTVPQQVSAQQGLGEGEERSEVRSFSAPTSKKDNMDALPPGSPDSSCSRSGSGSSLSNISEAMDMERDERSLDPDDLDESFKPPKDLSLPAEALDMIELLSGGSGSKHLSGSVPLAPRPGSAKGPSFIVEASPGSSRSNSRLGSDKHPVLPPIMDPQPISPI